MRLLIRNIPMDAQIVAKTDLHQKQVRFEQLELVLQLDNIVCPVLQYESVNIRKLLYKSCRQALVRFNELRQGVKTIE